MASQAPTRRAAAKQRWDAFPADVKYKLGTLRLALVGDRCLQKLQPWWAENQASLGELGITADTQVDPLGRSALFCASSYICFHADIVRYLVDVWGANIDLKDEWNGWTPLIAAAHNNKPGCVQVLLELGASPDLRGDDDDKTALEHAREQEHQKCVDLLEQWVPVSPMVKSALKG